MTNSVDFSPDQRTLSRNENSLNEANECVFFLISLLQSLLKNVLHIASEKLCLLLSFPPPTCSLIRVRIFVLSQNKKTLPFNHIIGAAAKNVSFVEKNRLSVAIEQGDAKRRRKSNFILALPRISFSDSSE